MKQLSIFSAQKSTSSRILCFASGGSFNIQNPTKLGRKGFKESCPRKATEILTESMESRLNSSGTSSQDSLRFSSADRSGQLDVFEGQSSVLSEIKAEVPLKNDIPSHQNLLLQRFEERINLLSQENKSE